MPAQKAGDAVSELLLAIDVLDWDTVRAALDDHVRLDYTSLFGGEVETVPGDDVVTRWRGLLPGFDATQHLTGPVVVNALGTDEARCRTTVRGYHYLLDGDDESVWMVAGQYDIRTRRADDGWQVTAITLHVHRQEGDAALPEPASKRAEAGTGSRASR